MCVQARDTCVCSLGKSCDHTVAISTLITTLLITNSRVPNFNFLIKITKFCWRANWFWAWTGDIQNEFEDSVVLGKKHQGMWRNMRTPEFPAVIRVTTGTWGKRSVVLDFKLQINTVSLHWNKKWISRIPINKCRWSERNRRRRTGRSNQSLLKEISPGCSLEGLMLKLKLQYFGHWCEEQTHLKRPWCWEWGWQSKESAWQCRRYKRHNFDPWVRRIPWGRNRQSTPVFLPGKFHGQKRLASYSLWSHKESDMTGHPHTQSKQKLGNKSIETTLFTPSLKIQNYPKCKKK